MNSTKIHQRLDVDENTRSKVITKPRDFDARKTNSRPQRRFPHRTRCQLSFAKSLQSHFGLGPRRNRHTSIFDLLLALLQNCGMPFGRSYIPRLMAQIVPNLLKQLDFLTDRHCVEWQFKWHISYPPRSIIANSISLAKYDHRLEAERLASSGCGQVIHHQHTRDRQLLHFFVRRHSVSK